MQYHIQYHKLHFQRERLCNLGFYTKNPCTPHAGAAMCRESPMGGRGCHPQVTMKSNLKGSSKQSVLRVQEAHHERLRAERVSKQQALVADWLRFGLSDLGGCDGI